MDPSALTILRPGLNYQVPHLCFLQFKLELLLSKGRK